MALQNDLPRRIQAVAKWVARGLTKRQIADRLNLNYETTSDDVEYIRQRINDDPDIQTYIKDIGARTKEELGRLDTLLAEQWGMYDWAAEMCIKVDRYGEKIPELDIATGDPIPGKWRCEPRRPGYMPIVMKLIQDTQRQRQELLKLLDPKVDINMSLSFQVEAQKTIVEMVREVNPELYAQIYRALQALGAKYKQAGHVPLANPDTLEGDFHVRQNQMVDLQ